MAELLDKDTLTKVVNTLEGRNVNLGNTLLRSSYKLSLFDKRLLLAGLAGLDSCGVGVGVTITSEAFGKLFGLGAEDARREFTGFVNEDMGLIKNVITIETEHRRTLTHWADSITFDRQTNELTIYFSLAVMPFLIGLKKNFTCYKIKLISNLSSIYSLRLYELFICLINERKRNYLEISYQIDTIKQMLGILDKYKASSDFFARVVNPAMKEITKYTDLDITYQNTKYIKKGKKITGFNLLITRKQSKCFGDK